MDVTFTLTGQDSLQLMRLPWRKPRFLFGLALGGVGGGVVGFAAMAKVGFTSLGSFYVACIGVAMIPLLIIWDRKQGAKKWAAKNPAYFSQTTVVISSQGVRVKNSGGDALVGWHDVRRVAEEEPYIYFARRFPNSIIVPETAFKTPDEARSFLASAISYWENAKGTPVTPKT